MGPRVLLGVESEAAAECLDDSQPQLLAIDVLSSSERWSLPHQPDQSRGALVGGHVLPNRMVHSCDGSLLRRTGDDFFAQSHRSLIEEVFGLLGGFNLSWLTTLEKFFIGQNATALGLSFGQAVQAARGGGPVVSSTPLVGAGQAVLVLAAYGPAFIAGSMLVVRRGDIT